MFWPSQIDYNNALQNPGFCFSDAILKRSTVEADNFGLPKAYSGGSAVVYQLVSPEGKKWAARCFLRHYEDSELHYAEIASALERLKLSSTVAFEYQPKGIILKGVRYPLIKMEWVEGRCLDQFMHLQIETNPAVLSELANKWIDLVRNLRISGIAHGDLHHGNIIVTERQELKLVDYDDMYVPRFKGWKSHGLGFPAYQHPNRSAQDFDEKVDHFSALVIYLSIRAIANDPDLAKRHHAFQYDNLVFRPADFQSPHNSLLFKDLSVSGSGEVRRLAQLLHHACVGPVESVPDFLEYVGSDDLTDVTPVSLCIETPGGRCLRLIPGNTPVPACASYIVSTEVDNQSSIELHILQGESVAAKDNRILGICVIDGIEPARKGVARIKCTLKIDALGILAVEARDQKTGKDLSIKKVVPGSGYTKEEINKLQDHGAMAARMGEENEKALDTVRRIADWICEEFKTTYKFDLSQDRLALSRVMDAAKKAETELADVPDTNIVLPFISANSKGPIHYYLTLTRDKFEQIKGGEGHLNGPELPKDLNFEVFKSSQCSWCRKFYTRPDLCPYGRLQSHCFNFDSLGKLDRDNLVNLAVWSHKILLSVQDAIQKGTLARCRNKECLSFNPNPQKSLCWKCGQDTLSCPNCRVGRMNLLLIFDTENDVWRCQNTACGKKFAFVPGKNVGGNKI
jgi:hypothetical protein